MKILRDKILFFTLLPMGLLTGCAATEPAQNIDADNLSTKIHANGAKMFVFTMGPEDFGINDRIITRAYEDSDEMIINGPDVSKESVERRNEFVDKVEGSMIDRLEEQLSATGYCREGYMLFEKTVNQSFAFIRGECEESATSEDRLRFAQQEKENTASL